MRSVDLLTLGQEPSSARDRCSALPCYRRPRARTRSTCATSSPKVVRRSAVLANRSGYFIDACRLLELPLVAHLTVRWILLHASYRYDRASRATMLRTCW